MCNLVMLNSGFERPSHWTNDRRFFFKYMNRATGRIVLENRTLRWSTPGTLNDPYDMQFDLHIDIDREAVKVATLQKLWDAFYGDQPAPVGNILGAVIQSVRGIFPQLTREEFNREYGETIDGGLSRMERALPGVQNEVRSLIAEGKILCLTELPDNIMMWTHYAESHQGIVLQFRSVPKLDSAWGVARPVQYLADMPRLLDNDFLADMGSGLVSMDAESIMDRLVYTKSAEWAYEREWRVFAGGGRNSHAFHEDLAFNKLELDAVIVGCRMPKEDRTAFAVSTRRLYPHASLLQAEKAGNQFCLEIKPLEG